MKQLQVIVAVALCVIFATCSAGCSKDDEPDDPEVEKRMTSIGKLRFVYYNGKITQELRNRSLDYEITYHESTIERKHRNLDGSTSKTVYNLQNGLITSGQEIYGDGTYQDRYEFSYENGRIKTYKLYIGGRLDEYREYEWKDGLIVRQTNYDYDYDVGVMKLFCDYQYSYTNDFDYGGAIVCLDQNSWPYDDFPESLVIQGYFGKLPKYLVSGAVDMSGYFEPPIDSFTYILDSDGYPLVMNGIGNYSTYFSWEKIN